VDQLLEIGITAFAAVIAAMSFALFQERQHRQEVGRVKADWAIQMKRIEDENDDRQRGLQSEINDLRAQLAGMLTVLSWSGPRGAPLHNQASQLAYGRLTREFSPDEIRSLAFELKLNPDELPGGTLSELALSLAQAAMRRGILRELLDLIESKRPIGGAV
jgi:hypothetical protein